MNTIYTQWHVLPYLRKLGARSPKKVDDAVNQIRIAVGNLDNGRKSLGGLQGDEFDRACKQHVENLITYRRWLRGWLKDIYDLLGTETPLD